MQRKLLVGTSVLAAAAVAITVLYIRQDEPPLFPTRIERAHVDAPVNQPIATELSKSVHSLDQPTAASVTGPQHVPIDDAVSKSASAAYELVERNLSCQIDREASISPKHIRITPKELCEDLFLEPLSREEVVSAITYAAENGNVSAQLDYALYASRMFEDERIALDPDAIRDFKERTVTFLESAGKAGESQAYMRLSDIYKNGVLASKDSVMAYAYADAYFRTSSNRSRATFMDNASFGLSGDQRLRGRQIADHILKQRTDTER